jgi:hypothetical protein
MSSPTFDTVTEASVIAQTKMELSLYNSSLDDLLLISLLRQLQRGINTWLTLEQKTAEIEVEDCRAQLPCDFIRMTSQISVFINPTETEPDEEDSPYAVGVDNSFAIPGGSPWPTGNPSGYWYENFASYQIINGYLVFNNTDYYTISTVKISYQGIRTDLDGNPVIPATHERMLVAGIKWKYAQVNYREIPANLRQEFMLEFKAQKAHHKGRENEMTPEDRFYAARFMNSLIVY